jgi:hypothetical protein
MIQTIAVMCLAFFLPPAVPFTTVAQGNQSGIESRREVVGRTAAEWQKLWREHDPDAPLPEVNFAKSMVVGVFLGFRNTGGYRAAITSIDASGSEIVVTWKESRPGPQDITSQVLTFPHHIVRAERLDGKVVFKQADR